jgi:putative Mg2+ transporter-C (MgtC) family protein
MLLDEILGGLPDARELVRVLVRLLGAMLLGAIAGFQREKAGKPAGLRTHMLVSMGSCLFVLVPIQVGMSVGDVSRIIQGVATGIGFVGAGAILKNGSEREIQGLTTAAGIWTTAAVGVAVGMGGFAVAVIGMLLAYFVLAALLRIEKRISPDDDSAGG